MPEATVSGPVATKEKGRKRPRPLLENIQEDASSAGDSKFARALGSVDAQTRNQGLQALAAWLGHREQVPEQEMSKIWKGLFFCFWHSDKQPVQKHLAERLAEIMLSLQPQVVSDSHCLGFVAFNFITILEDSTLTSDVQKLEVAVMYFRIFLRTMQREWFGIDRLRLDKFMLLVRCFLSQAALRLCILDWETEAVKAQADSISEEVLGMGGSATNLAAGLGYHMADVFISETVTACEECGKVGGSRPGSDGLHFWLEPFCQILAMSDRAAFLPRLQDGVFDKLVRSVQDGDAWLQRLDVGAFAAHLFALGAQPGIKARNRAVLYDVSGQLKKAGGKRLKPSPNLATISPSQAANGPSPSQPSITIVPSAAAAKGLLSPSALANGKHGSTSKRRKGKLVFGDSTLLVDGPPPADQESASAATAAATAAADDVAAHASCPSLPPASGTLHAGSPSASPAAKASPAGPISKLERNHKKKRNSMEAVTMPDDQPMPQQVPGQAGTGISKKLRKLKAGLDEAAAMTATSGVDQLQQANGVADASSKKRRKHKGEMNGIAPTSGSPAHIQANDSLTEPASAAAADIKTAIVEPRRNKRRGASQQPTSNVATPVVPSALQPASEPTGRLQRAASLEQEAAMATGGSDAEAVQEAQAAGTTLPGALHSPGSVAATPPASLQIPHANGDLVSPDTALRKKLRFSLQRNLYHASKGPVPPAEVRTPPNLQPKGSAIKKSATIDVVKSKQSRLGRAAPATTGKQGSSRKKKLLG